MLRIWQIICDNAATGSFIYFSIIYSILFTYFAHITQSELFNDVFALLIGNIESMVDFLLIFKQFTELVGYLVILLDLLKLYVDFVNIL